MKQLVCIAAPYTDKDNSLIEERVHEFLKFDNALINAGYMTVSALSKHFCLKAGKPIKGTYDYWRDYSRELIERSDALFVLTQLGWDTSVGVVDEMKWAMHCGKGVHYFAPGEPIREITKWGDDLWNQMSVQSSRADLTTFKCEAGHGPVRVHANEKRVSVSVGPFELLNITAPRVELNLTYGQHHESEQEEDR